MMAVLAALQQFQASIVGIIGFAGVILTLRTNARIVRENRQHSIDLERRALRLSLMEELRVIKSSYVEGVRSFRDAGVSACIVPRDRNNNLFKANLSKLGLLTRDELPKILDAYLSHGQVETQLNIMAEPGRSDGKPYVVIPPHYTDTGMKMYHNMIEPIDAALDALRAANTGTCDG